MRRVCKAVAQLLAVTLSALAFTVPVSLLVFGQVSLIAPLANLLFVNAGGVAMLCAGLCAAAGQVGFLSFLAYPFALAGGLIAKYLLAGSALLARVPFASVSLEPGLTRLWLAGTALLFVIVFLFRNRPRRLIRLAAICSVCALLAGNLACLLMDRGLTCVTVADVGNGTAIVVTRSGRAAVIGCGGAYDAATKVRSVLQAENITALDLLFLPRAQETEASAAAQLLESFPAQTVVAAETVDALPDGVAAVVSPGGQVRLWGDVTLTYLTREDVSCALLEIGAQRFFLSFYPGSVLSNLPPGWADAPVAICRAQTPEGQRAGVTLLSGEGERALSVAHNLAQGGRLSFATGGEGALRLRTDGENFLDIKRLKG